jgi:UDP-N-acetyl-2-amino-2-deoxyglucuronate dehydrogenase
MERVKTGIIGLGKVAHMHAKALQNLPESAFTAVCSRDIVKARAFAGQYQVEAYADVEEMIQAGGVEVLVICTPHPQPCRSGGQGPPGGCPCPGGKAAGFIPGRL